MIGTNPEDLFVLAADLELANTLSGRVHSFYTISIHDSLDSENRGPPRR